MEIIKKHPRLLPNVIYLGKLFLIIVVCLGLFAVTDLFLMKRMVTIAARDGAPFHDFANRYVSIHHSLMKLTNITHFPYWLRETKLPVYSITIQPNDLAVLNDSLPNNPFGSALLPENKIFVGADFESGDYADRVKIRYRGSNSNHWSFSKRSLLAVFSDDNLFNGMKSIDLVIPVDRGYLIELVNNLRLQRAGLVTPNMYFAWARINNQNAGVYLIKERFKEQWLEKNQIPTDSEVFTGTTILKDGLTYLQDIEEDFHWRHDVHEELVAFDELESFFALLAQADNETLEKNLDSIINLDKWYRAMAVTVLSGTQHAWRMNTNLLVNSALGRLEPVLEDINVEPAHFFPGIELYKELNLLSRYILSSPTLYPQYLAVLKEMATEENLQADLAFYDELTARLLPEFYKDQTKIQNDFRVAHWIKQNRAYMIDNYQGAQELAKITEPPLDEYLRPGTDTRPELFGSYRYVYDRTKSATEFIQNNPRFVLRGDGLLLSAGVYNFKNNIIIPKDTKLTIAAGARIRLAPEVSIISYSPIEMLGTANSPVVFEPLSTELPWGAVAVINVADTSILRHVRMRGGSSSQQINGVVFTGMFSAHQAPVEISDSVFTRDSDDDAVNIKYATGKIVNSTFEQTNGDAIDLDSTTDFIVDGNTFVAIGSGEGGDAIDISFSNALITNNTINGCEDKGISVGEQSNPVIENNTINGCTIGIAVKDKSEALIKANQLTDNKIGISVYQKKQEFGGATAKLDSNNFLNNQEDFNKDQVSNIFLISQQ